MVGEAGATGADPGGSDSRRDSGEAAVAEAGSGADESGAVEGAPDWSASFHQPPASALARTSAKPAAAHISAQLLQELIDWARDGYPNEACGIVAGDRSAAEGGRPSVFHRLTNAARSPSRYLIEPREQLDAMLAIDDADEVVWGVFHSHVASPAEPSRTDIGLAFYPDSLYLICSLASEVPVVRAWWIVDGQPTEVSLSVG